VISEHSSASVFTQSLGFDSIARQTRGTLEDAPHQSEAPFPGNVMTHLIPGRGITFPGD